MTQSDADRELVLGFLLWLWAHGRREFDAVEVAQWVAARRDVHTVEPLLVALRELGHIDYTPLRGRGFRLLREPLPTPDRQRQMF